MSARSVIPSCTQVDLTQFAAANDASKGPFFLIPFFEQGPEHYLTRNYNCSLGLPGEEPPELSIEKKALFVLKELQHLFQYIREETARSSSCAFIIQPKIHDSNPYLVNYSRLLTELLRPWLLTHDLLLKFREVSGLGAKNVQILVFGSSQTSNLLEMRSLL